MHIVYDYQIFAIQKYGGIGRYFVEIASRIADINHCKVTIFAPLYVNEYLKDKCKNLVIGIPIPLIARTAGFTSNLSYLLAERLLGRNSSDVLHETYYSSRGLSLNRSKTVITVYDMIHEKYSYSFRARDRTSATKFSAVSRADHIICISKRTQEDLVTIFNVDPSMTSVIYLGNSLMNDASHIRSRAPREPYLLYVGQRDGYKNFERLLRAYAGSEQLKRDFKLACFGGGCLSPNEQNLICRLGLKMCDVIHLTGDDSILSDMYRHASAFVCPSLYEGFGIPLLEAMSCGCPVICSSGGSLPEVGGNAVEYFDPHSVESILASIERVVYSSQKLNSLSSRGLERSKAFSWDTCAEQTLAVYTSLL